MARYISVSSLKYVPMNNDSTLFSTSEFVALVRKAVKQEKTRQPKESIVALLKNFAYNYRADVSMPEDLQGYVLS